MGRGGFGMSGGEAVTVVGIGEDGWPGLTGEARRPWRHATVIVGAQRHLALLPDLPGRRCRCRRRCCRSSTSRRGQPRALPAGQRRPHAARHRRHAGAPAGRRRIRVLPAVSSVALACARLGGPSMRSRWSLWCPARPRRSCPRSSPGARAGAVPRWRHAAGAGRAALRPRLGRHRGSSVLERLGGPAERVVGPYPAQKPDPGPFADLCVAALECTADRAPGGARVPGLPDDAYETDGQLTRRELARPGAGRARPGPRELLWDVGAGSGSVGIEWMRAAPRCRAIAVEPRRTGRSVSGTTPRDWAFRILH